MYEYRIKPGTWRVVDGDTVDIDIDLGFNITTRIRARLAGVDTPERGQKDFHYATGLLTQYMEFNDNTGQLTIRTGKVGKYGRWIVYLDGDINAKLAEKWPYPEKF